MNFEIKENTINQIPKGITIFRENEPALHVCILIKGSILVKSDFTKMTLPAGSFFGVCDLSKGHYMADYVTAEDSVIYIFVVKDKETLRNMLGENNKEYRGLVVNTMTRYFYELSRTSKEYYKLANDLYQLSKDGYSKYKEYCREAREGMDFLPTLEIAAPYQRKISKERKEMLYYGELARVPLDIQKSFFGYGIELTMFHVKELTNLIIDILADINDVCEYILKYFFALYQNGTQNLFLCLIKLANETNKKNRPISGLQVLIDKLIKEFYRMSEILTRCMGNPPSIEKERLEKVYQAFLNQEELEENQEQDLSDDEICRSLKGTLQQLLNFSELSKEKTASFVQAMNQFVVAKDRMSTEDDFRALRRQIADGFYLLYHAIFLKAVREETIVLPKVVELFLNYGLTDERLLTKEEIVQLYHLKIETNHFYHCTIFTIPEWLKAVYKGERQPSKNEFDLEYTEVLREQKKLGEITAEEEARQAVDPLLKLEYEIKNMFRYNHRLVNGQPSIFVPVLCSEQMASGPERALISKDRMGQTIEKYRDIDFSVFYRELNYADAEYNIEKEQVMREIVPDIILFPTYGQKAIMWQELSCKRRDSGGRFLFPIMMDGNIDDILIKTLGRFRWELCRTMQGSSWNNIQYRSLTSEYSDYIQFYKKNKDISEERKEKLKQQIAKAKNSTKEVFVQDYELWIKAECMGAMRLNKVSREIFAMYCPFKEEIRATLETQPAFMDAIARYKRERQKKIRELEFKYHTYTNKQGIELTKPLQDNLEFYKK